MRWQQKEPGHLQPCYWPTYPRGFLFFFVPGRWNPVCLNCFEKKSHVAHFVWSLLVISCRLLKSLHKRTCLCCIVSDMAVDDLAMQGARASADLILSWFAQDMLSSEGEMIHYLRDKARAPCWYHRSMTPKSVCSIVYWCIVEGVPLQVCGRNLSLQQQTLSDIMSILAMNTIHLSVE